MEPIKVMLVDDDKIILRDLERTIAWESQGFHLVAPAFNGKLGISHFRQYRPQIILTDIKMPIMNGIEMMREIRQDDPSVCFVILSAHGEFEYAQQAISLGAHDYILKDDITPETLLNVLLELKERLLSHSQMAYWSVIHLIQLYLENPKNDAANTLLGELDEVFHAIPHLEEHLLSSLTYKVSQLLQKGYAAHGQERLYTPPASRQTATKELLHGWIAEQIKVIDRIIANQKQDRYSPNILRATLLIQKSCGDKNLNIKQIADKLQISSSWLSIQFKNETGITVNNYIKNTRIQRAKELLRRGEYKVYEVADMVGYGSSQYFSKVFYQETGQQPQHYRSDEPL